MKIVLFVIIAVVAIIIAGLYMWRQADHHADRSEMARLIAAQPADPLTFNLSMIADLPEPAQRFFRFVIAPGTRLYTVARIEMAGKFGMGTKSTPNYTDMTATQVLAAPEGFVWKMNAGSSLKQLSGSDSQNWTRFWIAGLLPVARLGGDLDHKRSAFGRYIAEAVFWTPAVLLPGPGIEWQSINGNVARVTLTHEGKVQPVDIHIREDGAPVKVSFPRWSDANDDKIHRLQPFGGYLSGFQNFDGFRLPTHVEAGNHFETKEYFPFFVIDVSKVAFPPPNEQTN